MFTIANDICTGLTTIRYGILRMHSEKLTNSHAESKSTTHCRRCRPIHLPMSWSMKSCHCRTIARLTDQPSVWRQNGAVTGLQSKLLPVGICHTSGSKKAIVHAVCEGASYGVHTRGSVWRITHNWIWNFERALFLAYHAVHKMDAECGDWGGPFLQVSHTCVRALQWAQDTGDWAVLQSEWTDRAG